MRPCAGGGIRHAAPRAVRHRHLARRRAAFDLIRAVPAAHQGRRTVHRHEERRHRGRDHGVEERHQDARRPHRQGRGLHHPDERRRPPPCHRRKGLPLPRAPIRAPSPRSKKPRCNASNSQKGGTSLVSGHRRRVRQGRHGKNFVHDAHRHGARAARQKKRCCSTATSACAISTSTSAYRIARSWTSPT